MQVQAFGYAKDRWQDPDNPTELSEVTFVASPEILRCIARHLNEAADAIERHPGPREFDHVHLSSEWEGWSEGDVDVIVASPRWLAA